MSEETGTNVPATGTDTEAAATEPMTTDSTPSVETPAPASERTSEESAPDSNVAEEGTVDELAEYRFDDAFGFNDEQAKSTIDAMKLFGVTSKEQADKFVGFIKAMEDGRAEIEEQRTNEMLERWDSVLENDKEFGADYDANIDIAQKALDKYGDEELNKWLDSTGFNRNPMLIKAFWRIGKDLQDAKVLAGNAGTAPKLQHDKFGNPVFNLNKSFGQ